MRDAGGSYRRALARTFVPELLVDESSDGGDDTDNDDSQDAYRICG